MIYFNFTDAARAYLCLFFAKSKDTSNASSLAQNKHSFSGFFYGNLGKMASKRHENLDFNEAGHDDGGEIAPQSGQKTMPAPHHSIFTGQTLS